MEYENYTFTEALRYLAERAHVQLPEAEYSEEEKKKANIKQSLLNVYKLAATYYYYQMRNFKASYNSVVMQDKVTTFDDIYKYLPTLLKENRVYIIISPRYEIKLKDGTIDYVYNDREKEQYMQLADKSKIAHIGIVKGIGEINADDFWEKVLRPEVREKTFIQVNYNNVEEVIAQTFEDFMGKDTTARKEFAKKYITNINLAEIN